MSRGPAPRPISLHPAPAWREEAGLQLASLEDDVRRGGAWSSLDWSWCARARIVVPAASCCGRWGRLALLRVVQDEKGGFDHRGEQVRPPTEPRRLSFGVRGDIGR